MTIEFLPDDRPPDEALEDLPSPRRNPRRPWVVPVVLLPALALVIWGLTRQGSTHHPVALPSRPVGSPTPPACGGVLRCEQNARVPEQLRAAARRHLPEVTEVLAQTTLTERVGTGAYYLTVRRITIRTARSTVLIALHRTLGSPVTGASPIVNAPLGFGSVVVHKRLAAFEVDLQYISPETVPPNLAALQRLATDPGLESR